MTDSPAKSAQSFAPVSLVGAGPGDPALITAAGLDRLRHADVVIYDALAATRLLDEAPPHAQRIDVGKRGGAHKLTQDQINALLVEKAQQGGSVVRLKGGDPYLFGRGAEELAHLAAHGIDCEVIPGITAGIAAPMTAGIPITHRQLASTVTFVTGHEDPAKPGSAIDYAALAALITTGGTACFYMGVGRVRDIVEALTTHSLDPHTPAAIIQWGTTPRQRTARAPLHDLPRTIEQHHIGAPSIIVVGPVAALPDQTPGLEFFTRRPLFGQTILVTRTRHQASDLARRLETLGAEVIEAPTIALEPPASWEAVDAAIRDIHRYHWLVLTSTQGVAGLAARLEALGLDARHLAGIKIAAIGDATTDALREKLALRPDLVPTRFVAESLAAELIAQHDVAGHRFLLLRADIARPALPERLRKAGAEVTELPIYHNRLADALPDQALRALADQRVNWITFTSSSTARNLVRLLGDQCHLLEHTRLASIGPVTSDTLRTLGLEVTIEAQPSSILGLIEALTTHTQP